MKKILVILILLFSSIALFIMSNQKENEVILSNINNKIEGLAFYLQSEEGSEEYNSASIMPSKNDGYIFKEAICSDESIVSFNNTTWSLKVSNMQEGKIRCKLYFDIDATDAKNYILGHITTINTRSDFSNPLTNTTTGIIYEAEDNYGTTYYFAGAATDNYLQFGGYWWRIIRINGDNTIRLIYAGDLNDYSTGLLNGYDDAVTLYQTIGTYVFNTATNGQRYIGYYSETSNLHGVNDMSNIASQLNIWYQTNLVDYNKYISKNTLFCNDRTAYTDESGKKQAIWSDVPLYYGAHIRLKTNKEPSLKCSNNLDAFTIENIENHGYSGNGVLMYPIGLITADEVAFAGGVYNVSNINYYLYTNTVNWTMSPANYNDNNGREWQIGAPGGLNYNNGLVTNKNNIRPVINLNADIKLTGDGTASNPYVVAT